MRVEMVRCIVRVLPIVLLTMATGCQTTGKGEEGKNMMPAARISFIPYVRQVTIQSGESQYPNLFTGASYAQWGPAMAASNHMDNSAAPMTEKGGAASMDDEKMMDVPEEPMTPSEPMEAKESMAAAKEGATAPESDTAMKASYAAAQPVVIQCYLESQFPDMSIAYDAVGLRGMQFHLALPDGSEVLPVQKVLDSKLIEEPVGALRRYGRQITLYFPSQSIMVDNPAVTPQSQGVRLVLTGHESEFFFEWPATPDATPTARKPGLDKQALKLSRSAYREVSSRVKRFSHELD